MATLTHRYLCKATLKFYYGFPDELSPIWVKKACSAECKEYYLVKISLCIIQQWVSYTYDKKCNLSSSILIIK